MSFGRFIDAIYLTNSLNILSTGVLGAGFFCSSVLYNGLGITSTLRRHKQGFLRGKTEKRNLVFVIIKLRVGG